MARGELRRADAQRVHVAVDAAERATGLEFCVAVVRRTAGAARSEAEALFAEHGLHDRPAVLVLVAPRARWVEVVTAPRVRDRLSDDTCRAAVAVMVGRFRDADLAGGLEDGIAQLATAAGTGDRSVPADDLPDVLA